MDKLTITRCQIVNKKIERIERPDRVKDIFRVTINPSNYSRRYSLAYTGVSGNDAAIGQAAAAPKFSRAEAEKISFDLVLDGTGVVKDTRGKTVSDELARLRDIAYTYQGKEHEPSPVELNWGSELKEFRARLTSMSVDFTLFDHFGAPLRAKIKLEFIEALTPKEVAVEADNQSPDMTHLVRVVAGDTLPNLCQKIYKNAGAYLIVAQANGLDGFRDLEPNTILRFPPLR